MWLITLFKAPNLANKTEPACRLPQGQVFLNRHSEE